MADGPPERLDSWKAIAQYLNRDQRTVRRWERDQGLPVHRVPGGRGTSVFAFASEIDAWLTANRSGAVTREPGESPAAPAPALRQRWLPPAAVALTLALAVPVAWAVMRPAPINPSELRLDVTPSAAVAFDGQGRERWRYTFPTAYSVSFPSEIPWRVVEEAPPTVYLEIAALARQADGTTESGMLRSFDLEGHPQRTFAFDDHVPSGGRTLGPPWALIAFAVRGAGADRRIAVAAHHFVWNPGLVTLLDDQWRRLGTFVNDGWIEDVRWIAPNRLLVGGFSNARDGGMVALLDSGALEHARPGEDVKPLRIVIMPRTPVNRVTASPFNRVSLQLEPDRIVARTIEVPNGGEAADAIYEFTPALDLLSARYSDRYRELRRALETQGKLPRTGAAAAEGDQPREIQVWDRASGWKTVPIGPDRKP